VKYVGSKVLDDDSNRTSSPTKAPRQETSVIVIDTPPPTNDNIETTTWKTARAASPKQADTVAEPVKKLDLISKPKTVEIVSKTKHFEPDSEPVTQSDPEPFIYPYPSPEVLPRAIKNKPSPRSEPPVDIEPVYERPPVTPTILPISAPSRALIRAEEEILELKQQIRALEAEARVRRQEKLNAAAEIAKSEENWATELTALG
jgi:hypothetical protein